MGCSVVAEFLLTSALRSLSAIAEPLVIIPITWCFSHSLARKCKSINKHTNQSTNQSIIASCGELLYPFDNMLVNTNEAFPASSSSSSSDSQREMHGWCAFSE